VARRDGVRWSVYSAQCVSSPQPSPSAGNPDFVEPHPPSTQGLPFGPESRSLVPYAPRSLPCTSR